MEAVGIYPVNKIRTGWLVRDLESALKILAVTVFAGACRVGETTLVKPLSPTRAQFSRRVKPQAGAGATRATYGLTPSSARLADFLPLAHVIKPLFSVDVRIRKRLRTAVASNEWQGGPVGIGNGVFVFQSIDLAVLSGHGHAETVAVARRVCQQPVKHWRTITYQCQAVSAVRGNGHDVR